MGISKKNWSLDAVIYCRPCKIECITTEKGIICPKCGAFITENEGNKNRFSR